MHSYLESRDIKSARKEHECDQCYTKIEIGESYSRYTWVYDRIGHTKTCECCIAFAKAFPKLAEQTNRDGDVYVSYKNYPEFAANFAINKLLTE